MEILFKCKKLKLNNLEKCLYSISYDHIKDLFIEWLYKIYTEKNKFEDQLK